MDEGTDSPLVVASGEALDQAAYLMGNNPVLLQRWGERYILACNAGVERVLGYTAAELRGQEIRLLYSSDEDYARFNAANAQVIATGPLTCHAHMRRHDGTVFSSESLLQPIVDARGAPVAVISIYRDLSEPQGARPNIHTHGPKRPAAHLPGAVIHWVRTAAGRESCPFIAGDLLRTLALDPDALREDMGPLLAHIHPAEVPILQRMTEVSYRQLTPIDVELRCRIPGDRERWLRLIAQPYRVGDGTTIWDGVLLDITGPKGLEREAQRLTDRLNRSLDGITDGLFTVDRNWRFTFINGEAERLLRRPREALLGRVLWEECPQALGKSMEREYRRAIAEGLAVSCEQYDPRLGKWLDIRACPCEGELAVHLRDVTQWHGMVDRLREQEVRLRHSREHVSRSLETRQVLINSLPAHIALLASDGTIIDVNDAWLRFAEKNGYPGSGIGHNYLTVCREASGEGVQDAANAAEGLAAVLAGQRDSFTLEYPCSSPEEPRWFRLMANRLTGYAEGVGQYGAVVMHVDITARKQAEHALNRVAYEDRLTGLLNRQGFMEACSHHVGKAGWTASSMVVMLDIEGLRDINDAYGYDLGDELLVAIGGRLRARAGECGTVARTGGNEFAVFLSADSGREPLELRRVLAAAFEEPFYVNGFTITVSARFGYTILGKLARDAQRLMREAELALFEARSRDLPGWIAFTGELDRRARQRIALTRELRLALGEGQFELHYQPKVQLTSGELVACEALLRWNHPERGVQSPGSFIPVAERNQLIGPIGAWVLFEACRHLRRWQDAGMRVRIAVNVSVVQFRLGHFAETVRTALDTYNIDPAGLTLEITESVFEHESQVLRRQLRELHEMGVRLSLDDFGTGYSSLLYLQQHPFDEIKIDMGFVHKMLGDPYSRKIVTTVLDITNVLGAEAVAEGVESAAVGRALLDMGCPIGQGYYYSKPLAVEHFQRLLEQGLPLPLGIA